MTGYAEGVSVLARELLTLAPGERVRTEEFEERLGRERTAAALKDLSDQGAIGLAHGSGEIYRLDFPQLWQAAGLGTVMALMPLAYSQRFQGMATGLHQVFSDAGIPFRLGFVRGAKKRTEALLEGRCDFIVTSKMTARLDLEQGLPITLMHVLGFRTLAKEYVAAFRDPAAREIVSGMRVALDPVSIDQTILTSYECEGKQVEFVQAPYVQSLEKLAADELDAVIWSLDELEERGLGFNLQPLSDKSPRRVAGEDTAAVLATSREKAELGGILVRRIDFAAVQSIQHRVLTKQMQASY